jgi:predicted PurR-regulated permease PerM
MLIVGPLVVLAIQIAREAVILVQAMRELRETGLATPDWVSQFPLIGGYLASWWQDYLADPDAAKRLLGRAESLGAIQWTRSLGGEIVSRFLILAFTLLTLLFAYRDGPAIINQGRYIADRLFGPSGEHSAERPWLRFVQP